MITLLSLVSAAAAGPCDTFDGGLVMGPTRAGFFEGDLGRGRSPCLRSAVGFDGGAYAVVDTANFYGHLVGAGALSGSVVFAPRLEANVSVEAVRYETVIAPLTSSYLGLGTTTAGLAWKGGETDHWAWGMNSRLVIPTSSGLYQNAFPFGLDVGVAASWMPVDQVELHGQWSVLGSTAVSTGPGYARMGLDTTLGAAWRPGRAFSLGLDLVGGFGHDTPLDVLAVAPAFRFGLGRHAGLALEAAVPLAGSERALATGDLRFDWRL